MYLSTDRPMTQGVEYLARFGTFLLLLPALMFVFCSNPIGSARSSSSEDEVFWPSSPAESYVIDQQRSCFCPQRGFVRLTVVNDSIVKGVDTDNGSRLTPEELDGYRTIDELFVLIDEAEKSNADVLNVEYDSAYGYPSYIYLDQIREMLDEELAIRTSLVQISP